MQDRRGFLVNEFIKFIMIGTGAATLILVVITAFIPSSITKESAWVGGVGLFTYLFLVPTISFVLTRTLGVKEYAKLVGAQHREQEKWNYYEAAVHGIIERAVDTNCDSLREYNYGYEQLYNVPKGDSIVFMAPAIMTKIKTRTKTVAYHGPSLRVRIAKGVSYRAAVLAPSRTTEEYVSEEGRGIFVITNKRVAFVARFSGKNWSKTWTGVSGWEYTANSLRMHPSSGSPVSFVFGVPGAEDHAMRDPRIACAALDILNS